MCLLLGTIIVETFLLKISMKKIHREQETTVTFSENRNNIDGYLYYHTTAESSSYVQETKSAQLDARVTYLIIEASTVGWLLRLTSYYWILHKFYSFTTSNSTKSNTTTRFLEAEECHVINQGYLSSTYALCLFFPLFLCIKIGRVPGKMISGWVFFDKVIATWHYFIQLNTPLKTADLSYDWHCNGWKCEINPGWLKIHSAHSHLKRYMTLHCSVTITKLKVCRGTNSLGLEAIISRSNTSRG